MNPNLNYAQLIKGKKSRDNPYGIIDARALAEIPDDVLILSRSKSWTGEDARAMRKWFSDYLDWLVTSPAGKKEGESGNNHGFWWDAQVVPIALFTGAGELALKTIELKTKQRIADQIEPDGSMPLELKRTKSLHYSLFTLEAQFNLAQAAQSLDLDLWSFETPDGRGIRKALNFLIPFLEGKKEWPYREISPKGSEKKEVVRLLRWAANAWGDEEYSRIAEKAESSENPEDLELLYR